MFLIHTSSENTETVARAVTSACRLEGWQSPVQPRLLHTLFNRLLGQDLDFEKIAPTSPAEVAATLRSDAERNELIQLMVAIEILCNPIPEQLERSIVQWATALHVHERSLLYARDLMHGELTKAVHDFYRMNWIADLDRRSPEFEALLRHVGDKAYALTIEADAVEVARWTALASCPQGSIGRSLWEFYKTRGFTVPGQPGSVNAAVAQHDWEHVLADYGTTPMVKSRSSAFRQPRAARPARCSGSSAFSRSSNPVLCRRASSSVSRQAIAFRPPVELNGWRKPSPAARLATRTPFSTWIFSSMPMNRWKKFVHGLAFNRKAPKF